MADWVGDLGILELHGAQAEEVAERRARPARIAAHPGLAVVHLVVDFVHQLHEVRHLAQLAVVVAVHDVGPKHARIVALAVVQRAGDGGVRRRHRTRRRFKRARACANPCVDAVSGGAPVFVAAACPDARFGPLAVAAERNIPRRARAQFSVSGLRRRGDDIPWSARSRDTPHARWRPLAATRSSSFRLRPRRSGPMRRPSR